MAGDISPMSPASPTPLVREKRHYPGEQKEKNQKKKAPDDQANDDEQAKNDSDNDVQQNTVNIDQKNVKIEHIDEYV